MKEIYFVLALSLLVLLSETTLAQNKIVSKKSLAEYGNFEEGAKYPDVKLPADERVADVVKRMTLNELIDLNGGWNTFYFPGIERLGLRPIYMADASQGIRLRNDEIDKFKTTSFPGTVALASTWNPELALEMGRSLGEECRMQGVDILLGPGINMQRFSVSGRNYEYMGEDPLLTSILASEYIKGLQSNDVIATAKHFIGNDQEFCRHLSSSNIDERTLREIYLRPWEAVIKKGGVKAIMAGNNLINGIPCSMDEQLVQFVLRDEFGFKGLAMTDWSNTVYHPERQYLYLNSGINLLMCDHSPFKRFINGFLSKYPQRKDEIRKILEKKVSLTLLPLFENGVYDRPYKDESANLALPKHRKIAKQIADEAICLLKNEQNLLPLSHKSKVVLMGKDEIHSGVGSGFVQGFDHVSFEDGLKATFNNFKVLHSIDEAEIKKADVVIYRLNKNAGEGRDIPFNEGIDKNISKIAAINPNVVVIVSACNGMPMPWLKNVKVVIWSYYLGQVRGESLADVLVGNVNPSGKLPFTLETDFKFSSNPRFNYIGEEPYYFGDNKRYRSYWLGNDSTGASEQFRKYVKPHEIVPVDYNEGVFMGYRWFDMFPQNVYFPFGHGLSYTQFEYGDAKLSGAKMSVTDSLKVTLEIKNIGKRFGKETIQLYVQDVNSSVKRPIKELKAFKKVGLNPGQLSAVSFWVKPNDLAFWDMKSNGWIVEEGVFKIMIGASSTDIKQTVAIEYVK